MINSPLEDIEAAACNWLPSERAHWRNACWSASMKTTKFSRPGSKRRSAAAMRSTAAKWAQSISTSAIARLKAKLAAAA
jgi:hypothetical protein